MSKKEQWIFLQKFSKLLDAALPVEDALVIAAKNIRNKKFAQSVEKMILGVVSGKSLGDIFLESAASWGKATAALISVGELSGTLAANLLRASENMRNQAERRTRMLSALFYPAIISTLAFGIIVFLLAFVYPKITPLFTGMNAELPISTKIIMKGSVLVGTYWLGVFSGFALFIGLLYYLTLEFVQVRMFMERVMLSFPIVGNLIVLNQLCETSFIVGSLCQGGMSVVESVETAQGSVRFMIIRKKIKDVHAELASGTSFSECISRQKLFPSLWVDLISVGEKTGSLSPVLLNISEMHRCEIDEKMALLNKLVEPLMMIVVGGVVGFIALSIITPMYSLTQHVQGT